MGCGASVRAALCLLVDLVDASHTNKKKCGLYVVGDQRQHNLVRGNPQSVALRRYTRRGGVGGQSRGEAQNREVLQCPS